MRKAHICYFLFAPLILMFGTLGSAQTTITVAPTSVELAVGQTQTFSATLANAQSGDAVVWTDTTGQNLFSPAGLGASGVPITWTAPNTPGTYVITAASELVPTATAIATVTVMATAPAPCDTSVPLGICQPYTYIPVSGSNGYNTNVQNDFWNEAAAPVGSTQPMFVSGFGLGSWYTIDNFPAGETEIWTYPDSDPIYSGYADSNINDFQYIYSSYAENMEQYLNPSTTDAEAAYDIWLNNYNNEVMIWVDQANRGGAGYFGCNSTPAVTGLQFGGSNGVPVSLWDLDICSRPGSGEEIWLRDQADEPGIGSATVYGIPSSSVDVLSMLQWMENNQGCSTRRGVTTCVPYLPVNSNLVQLEFGFEIASTGGQNEEFGVNGYSVSSTIPVVPVSLSIPWTPPAAITYGTALSATQLDAGGAYNSATAYNGNIPIAGTYTYSLALGTVLPVGAQTLSVTFTPNDTTDYATTTQTVPLTVTSTGSVPSSGTTCNGTYNGTFHGNLMVSAGQTCIFTNGGVTGNVQQSGGTLEMDTSTISGNLQIGGGTFTVTSGSTINGNLQIQGISAGSATNQVCGSTIKGNLQLQNNGAGVLLLIGAPASSCAGNTIHGNLQIQNNAAAVSAIGNTVSGNLTVQNNSGATIVDSNTVQGNLQDQSNTASTDVSSDTVGGNLQCQGNTSITGGGDTAGGHLQGQCSTY